MVKHFFPTLLISIALLLLAASRAHPFHGSLSSTSALGTSPLSIDPDLVDSLKISARLDRRVPATIIYEDGVDIRILFPVTIQPVIMEVFMQSGLNVARDITADLQRYLTNRLSVMGITLREFGFLSFFGHYLTLPLLHPGDPVPPSLPVGGFGISIADPELILDALQYANLINMLVAYFSQGVNTAVHRHVPNAFAIGSFGTLRIPGAPPTVKRAGSGTDGACSVPTDNWWQNLATGVALTQLTGTTTEAVQYCH